MNKYQNGKIYKLVDNTTGYEYYGSTIQDLKTRKGQHKSLYKLYLENTKSSKCSSFKIIQNNNYEIYLVENFPCNSKSELEAREGYYIKNNNCVNKCIPGRTKKEWRKYNKEYRKEYFNQYYINNKEKLKEVNKQYRINNKEKFKQYRIKNKEKMKEYRKQYREKNQHIIKIKRKEYFMEYHFFRKYNNIIYDFIIMINEY